MSKRKLTALVDEKLVEGWDDPRMYTLQGLRRRGYTPAAMRLFVERIGISKQNSIIDFSVLENCLRENLDTIAPRRMATIAPMKLVLTNLPEDHEEQLIFPTIPKTTHKAPEQCRSHANYGSNAMIFPKSPPRAGNGWFQAEKYAYAVPASHV